ncbi:hypothetical protein FACS1894188_07880 [Clostridia bacterium]|nr:hypothetical protein FACS1894188_07880 [Clostridia bacterium]
MFISGKRLKELRKSKKVTQAQTADFLGIDARSYQRLEYGGTPSIGTLVTLADYFGVSVDYLIGRTDNPDVTK